MLTKAQGAGGQTISIALAALCRHDPDGPQHGRTRGDRRSEPHRHGHLSGRSASCRAVAEVNGPAATNVRSAEGRVPDARAKAAWTVADWLGRRVTTAG